MFGFYLCHCHYHRIFIFNSSSQFIHFCTSENISVSVKYFERRYIKVCHSAIYYRNPSMTGSFLGCSWWKTLWKPRSLAHFYLSDKKLIYLIVDCINSSHLTDVHNNAGRYSGPLERIKQTVNMIVSGDKARSSTIWIRCHFGHTVTAHVTHFLTAAALSSTVGRKLNAEVFDS